MLFFGIQIKDINIKVIQSLIENKISEGKTIDFKQEIHGNSDSDIKEFLADVSSFANASGGHLIYGIKEQAGTASEICGLELVNPDETIRRFESSIQSGIEPKIHGISIVYIPINESHQVLIISIPKSWVSPHMVIFKGTSRFYSRDSRGKHQLDVNEIRQAFLLSSSVIDHIRNFRRERLGHIMADETPIQVYKGPKIVLHLAPISTVHVSTELSIFSLSHHEKLFPLYSHGYNYRYNFDGILHYNSEDKFGNAGSYLQLFRDGSIETVQATMLARGNEVIPSITFEESIIQATTNYLESMKLLGLEPPIFIMLSLIGVNGFTMGVGSRFNSEACPIDRENLIIPEIATENFELNPASILKPIFDAVWNATGWARSMNYDESGKWAPPK